MNRGRSRLAAAVIGIVGLLIVGPSPSLAKCDAVARLDPPIATGARPGEIITVTWTVSWLCGGTPMRFEKTGVFIRLVGDDMRQVFVNRSAPTPGRYVGRIAVPAGGIRRVEIGMNEWLFRLEGPVIAPASNPPPIDDRRSETGDVPGPAIPAASPEAPARDPVWPVIAMTGALAAAASVGLAVFGRSKDRVRRATG
jgi:hypothetical protein